MSRHQVKHPTEPKRLVYGYERMTREYFWQQWDDEAIHEFVPADSSLEQCQHSGEDLCEKLKEYGMGVADSHYCAAAMSMPIEQEPNIHKADDQD